MDKIHVYNNARVLINNSKLHISCVLNETKEVLSAFCYCFQSLKRIGKLCILFIPVNLGNIPTSVNK